MRPIVIAVGLALLLAGTASADEAEEACDPRYFLYLAGTYVDFDDRMVQDQTGSGVRAALGRRNCSALSGHSHWELDLRWNSVEDTGVNDDDQFGLMVQRLRRTGTGPWQPHWLGGLGIVQEVSLAGRSIYPAIEAGIGLQRTAGASGLALRLDATVQGVFNDDARTGNSFHHDARLSLGVVLPMKAAPRPATGAGTQPAGPATAPWPGAAPPPAEPDSDGDGVPDRIDECPDTMLGQRVGGNGCLVAAARDRDGDGVPDVSDACPDTLAGLKVDEQGCVQRTAQTLVLEGVLFASDSADLDDAAQEALDAVYQVLSAQPDLVAEIAGHTDASGRESENRKLSQRRADSVRLYLVGRGIAAGRLKAVGHGSAAPRADNAEPEGRARNRRVELKILD